MLFLLFQLGDTGYALEANRIIQMLPFIVPKPIRGSHPQVAGSIAYRGRYLPVVDVALLETGRPAAQRMGTRIIVTQIQVRQQLEEIGLILESATETLRCEPDAFQPFARGPRGLVQRIDLDTLLSAHLGEAIFQRAEPVS